MGALPQRLSHERGETHLERLAQPARLRQPLAQHVERPEAELAEVLSLEQDPVVVPIGQEVSAERGWRHIERNGCTRIERAPRERLDLA
jgi:hypothetical protein